MKVRILPSALNKKEIMKQKEIHPYLDQGKIDGATKLILGSFPVYACTHPDNKEKETIRNKTGTVNFFYGSCKSQFWGLYHQYIDDQVTVPVKKKFAIESLKKHKIAISDTIISCNRKDKSALDSDLTDRLYNTKMIQDIIKSGAIKILCTSKGVMDDLTKRMIKPLDETIYDENETIKFQNIILQELGGRLPKGAKSFCNVFKYKGNLLSVIAIPSPGSPQRQIDKFGWVSGSGVEYASKYFKYAFNWLKQ